MLEHASQFGIYLNAAEHKVVRITSPYWLPEPPDWVYVTDEVNAILIAERKRRERQTGLLDFVKQLREGR